VKNALILTCLAPMVALGGMVLAPPAQAEGVEMTFGLGFRAETNSNLGLDPVSAGRSSKAGVNLSFGLISETPISRLSFDAAAGLLSGHGANLPSSGLNDPSLKLSYQRNAANADFNLSATLTDVDLTSARDVTDFDTGSGARRTASLSTGINWGTAAPLGFGLTAGVSDVRYHDTPSAGLTNSRSTRLGATARADLSEVLHLNLGLRDTHFEKDGAATRDTLGLDVGLTLARPQGELGLRLGFDDTADGQRNSLSFEHRIDLPRAALSYSLGATRGVTGRTFATGALNYMQELPNGALNLGLNRAVQSSSETDAETVQSSASLGWRQAVTPSATLALSLNWAEQLDTATDLVTTNTNLSAVWSQSLTADWALDLGYTRRLRDQDPVGQADSDSVFLELRRDFSIRF
jgi:hypothetical protein